MVILLYVLLFISFSFNIGNTVLLKVQHEDNQNNSSFQNMNHHEEIDMINGVSNLSNLINLQTTDIASVKKKQKLEWWQTNFVYEIYPRSFKDSNGNGVGDLQGIIEKIPYLKDLGVGAIWITPIYPSPGYDLGYDISDYKNIDELMGSMDDFDELVAKLHKNGIKILLDFVPNHTSDEHEWFVKSVQKIEPYTEYYVWANATYANGTRQVPNNWISLFKGSMWEWNEEREQYYLHQFYKQQPDLNFRNPLVREEIKNVLRFWLDKGVDGFRCDAVSRLYERQDLKDAPLDKNNNPEEFGYVKVLDEIFEEVIGWRAVLDEYQKNDGITRLLVAESYMSVEYEKRLYGNSTHPGVHFPLSLTLGYLFRYETAKSYVDVLTKFFQELPSNAWPSWNIGNHDFGRPTTHFGAELIDGILMMQLLLPGSPVIYMADELGMTATRLRKDQLVDVKSIQQTDSLWKRDENRTPFQWDSTAQAGFSKKTKPWLPVNPNYVTLNVDYQTNATRSHLKTFKELVKLRQLEVFRSGEVKFYEVSKYVFAFSRSNSIYKIYFVVINLGSELECINLKRVKRMIPPKLTVKVASLFAEQNAGDVIHSKSFTLRPKAALVLES